MIIQKRKEIKLHLTDLKIKKLKSKGTREILWDACGLGIRIGERKKTWVFRYTFAGKRSVIALGIYPGMSLAEARSEAAKTALDVQRGIDPRTSKRAAKEARKVDPNFEDLVDEYWHRELSKQSSGSDRLRLLKKDVIPHWGKRKVADIKRRDIVLRLDDIGDRSKSTRNHVHGVLGRIFNFAAERGIIDDSPCGGVRKLKETPRKRVLSDEEIRLVWTALAIDNRAIDIYIITKLALRMILLTGQRPGEIAGMRWDELDQEKWLWTIPEGRMKGGEAHQVPVCPMAKELLEQARVYSDGSPYVFCFSYNPGEPVTRAALSRAISRHLKEMGIKVPFTPHDLRRTFRTRLAEIGVSDVIAERVLGHKLQGMLGVYNKYSYDIEKRQALEKWEDKLRTLVGFSPPETPFENPGDVA